MLEIQNPTNKKQYHQKFFEKREFSFSEHFCEVSMVTRLRKMYEIFVKPEVGLKQIRDTRGWTEKKYETWDLGSEGGLEK